MYFASWPAWLRSPGSEHSRASFVLQILLHHRQRAEILVAYGAHDQRSQKREQTRQSRCRGAIDPRVCAERFQPIANVNGQAAEQQPRLLVKCDGDWGAKFRHAAVQQRLFPVDIHGAERDWRVGHLRRRAIEARRWQPPRIVRQVSDQRKDVLDWSGNVDSKVHRMSVLQNPPFIPRRNTTCLVPALPREVSPEPSAPGQRSPSTGVSTLRG